MVRVRDRGIHDVKEGPHKPGRNARRGRTFGDLPFCHRCYTSACALTTSNDFLTKQKKGTKDQCDVLTRSRSPGCFCIALTEVPVFITSHQAPCPPSQQTDACIFPPTWMKHFYCCFRGCHGEKETCFVWVCSLANVPLLPQRCALIMGC